MVVIKCYSTCTCSSPNHALLWWFNYTCTCELAIIKTYTYCTYNNITACTCTVILYYTCTVHTITLTFSQNQNNIIRPKITQRGHCHKRFFYKIFLRAVLLTFGFSFFWTWCWTSIHPPISSWMMWSTSIDSATSLCSSSSSCILARDSNQMRKNYLIIMRQFLINLMQNSPIIIMLWLG